MIKILGTSQVRELDEFTIKNEPVKSIDLMERACLAFVDWFKEYFSNSNSVLIVCGTSNNGGDGLGIARQLIQNGFDVSVVIARISQSQTPDFKENLGRLPKKVNLNTVDKSHPLEFPKCDVVIDALVGSGLSRPLEGFATEVVKAINEMNSIRVAVDCPSGLMMDISSTGPAVEAHHTVSFHVPRLAFMFPQSFPFVGHWHVVNIGLDRNFIEQLGSKYFLVDELSARRILKPKSKFSHKGSNGHSLIIAGSQGKVGANILATTAAIRAGSGLVTSLTPGCGYIPIQSAVPEAMVITDPDDNQLTQLPELKLFNAFGVGPGLGTNPQTVSAFTDLLKKNPGNLVLDADALNILASDKELQNLVPPGSILTPHPREFKRLVGDWANDFERLDKQISLATRLKSIVVLKGAHTSIATPQGLVYFNNTGNPAMATGGSGDVLTGILTAMLAQGYSAEEASILGVYVHGLAGDFAAKSKATIMASDIISEIPYALKWLQTAH